MSAPKLIDPCSQFALLTDRQAVGEVLSQEESRWVIDHARTCAACGAEMAIYAAMPRLLGATRVSSPRGSHHPRTYRAPSRHAESRKRISHHDASARPGPMNGSDRAPNLIASPGVPAMSQIANDVAARRAAPADILRGAIDSPHRTALVDASRKRTAAVPEAPVRKKGLDEGLPVLTRGRKPSRALKVWILAAAVITLGGVATAQFVTHRPPSATPPSTSAEPTLAAEAAHPSHKSPANSHPGLAASPALESTPAAPVAPIARHAAVAGSPAQPKSVQATPAAESVEPQPSIEDLLRDARNLRAKGHASEAAAAYQRLIRDYPRSPEARTARVSVGELQLGHLADPAGALASFDAYLQGGPGALTLEARHGRIRALTALGRTADEQREIAKFIKDYPSSPQAAVLSARLAPSPR